MATSYSIKVKRWNGIWYARAYRSDGSASRPRPIGRLFSSPTLETVCLLAVDAITTTTENEQC